MLSKLPPPTSGGLCSLPGLDPERILRPNQTLDVSKQAEASSTLHKIRKLREQTNSPPHLMVAIYYTLGLLHTVTRELDKVMKGRYNVFQV